jgi:L-glyceraldehyde 3-phosphate reductase
MAKPYFLASEKRYDEGMTYRRTGNSGILLPVISLGLWHNFGQLDDFSNCQEIAHYAFDHGITHFDLANNYGPPYGAAEETFGKIMKGSFSPYRQEMFISTKAGHGIC